ncbi:MAG TPA: delta-60 repeat domain-containing protein, partial [Phototrophicaceae bacterium]|nr:delta-60 repeat domain-containing protein [Phototrophicaceae bacterium]
MGMITLIVGIFITTALLAAPIGLDPTFGTGGMTITDFDTGSGIDCDVATDVVIQPDGKIILGGEQDNCADFVYKFSLARYNPDGTLDPNFGTGGLVLIDGSHDQDWGNALTLQPDGKILIAGTGDRFGFFEVLRLDPNGVLDPTFGVNGTVLTSLGTDYQMGYDIALQLDGKIVVAGAAGPSFDNADFALVRYNSDGSIDSTFGVGGIVTTSFTADSDDAANTLVIQPDGKIVAAGKSRNLTPPAGVTDFALARYNSDGTLDLTFNGTGLVTTSLATTHNEVLNLVLQPDNKLITSGKASDANKSHLGVARYNTDGGLDTSFDGDGKFISQLDSQTMAGESILVLPDNKIMVGGYGGGAHPANMALALFNSDGSPDTSFDGDGF